MTTFVDTLQKLRHLKESMNALKTSMDAASSATRNPVEKQICNSIKSIAETFETRIGEITTDVSKLALNSPEDIEKIMDALSK